MGDIASYFDELIVMKGETVTINGMPDNYTFKVYDGLTLVATSGASSAGVATADISGFEDLLPFTEIVCLDTVGGIAARFFGRIYGGDEYGWVQP